MPRVSTTIHSLLLLAVVPVVVNASATGAAAKRIGSDEGDYVKGSPRRSEPAEANVDAGEGIVAGLSADLDGYIVSPFKHCGGQLIHNWGAVGSNIELISPTVDEISTALATCKEVCDSHPKCAGFGQIQEDCLVCGFTQGECSIWSSGHLGWYANLLVAFGVTLGKPHPIEGPLTYDNPSNDFKYTCYEKVAWVPLTPLAQAEDNLALALGQVTDARNKKTESGCPDDLQDTEKGGTVAAVVIVLLLLLLGGGGGAYYYYYHIGRKRDAHEKSAAARNARKTKGHHGGHDFHDNPSFADNQDWSAESGTTVVSAGFQGMPAPALPLEEPYGVHCDDAGVSDDGIGDGKCDGHGDGDGYIHVEGANRANANVTGTLRRVQQQHVPYGGAEGQVRWGAMQQSASAPRLINDAGVYLQSSLEQAMLYDKGDVQGIAGNQLPVYAEIDDDQDPDRGAVQVNATMQRCKYRQAGPGGQRCKAKTSTEWCEKHTCSTPACKNSKASKDVVCLRCPERAEAGGVMYAARRDGILRIGADGGMFYATRNGGNHSSIGANAAGGGIKRTGNRQGSVYLGFEEGGETSTL